MTPRRFVALWLLAALAILCAADVLSPRVRYALRDQQPPWLRLCACKEAR